MSERSSFGVRLWRLLSGRRPAFQTSVEEMRVRLAEAAGLPAASLHAVNDGTAPPTPEMIRRLAAPLGIHTADLFVIAGLPVPASLASARRTSPWDVGAVVAAAARLGADRRAQLHELVRSLPARTSDQPPPADDFPEGPGALLIRLLRNRNIQPNAKLLYTIGGGPYVSDSTIAMLGEGLVVITPQYVTAFAHLLGYAPEDLVALTGVGPVFDEARAHPVAPELAALAWAARRLDSDQLTRVWEAAR